MFGAGSELAKQSLRKEPETQLIEDAVQTEPNLPSEPSLITELPNPCQREMLNFSECLSKNVEISSC